MELQLAIKTEIPDWYLDAQCFGTDTGVFFPDGRGESVQKARMESLAKSICDVCIVREACLQHAILNNEPEGVWGGKTQRERDRIRARRGQ